MKKKKILLVDDTVTIVETLSEVLISNGYDIVPAFDGSEAIELLKSITPDLVIIDYMMPKMNGIETIKMIRSQWQFKDMPIFLISAFADKELVEKAIGTNVSRILCKPFTPAYLVQQLPAILGSAWKPLSVNENANNNKPDKTNNVPSRQSIFSKLNKYRKQNITEPSDNTLETKQDSKKTNIGINILVIGARPGDAYVFDAVEKQENMKFILCNDIKTAASLLTNKTFNGILVEWSIHGDSGLSIVKALRNIPKLKTVPIGMLCYGFSKKFMKEADKSKVSEIFIRPLEVDEIGFRIKKFIHEPEDKTVKDIVDGTKQAQAKKEPWIIIDEKGNEKIDLNRLARRIMRLSSPPMIVSKILRIINNPISNVKDLSNVIKTDLALSAKILQLINSPYYGLLSEVNDITHAVGYLGFDVVKKISLGVASYNSLVKKNLPKGFEVNSFWEHSLATAVFSRTVANVKGSKAPEDLFIAGLMHDVGKTILSEYVTDRFTNAFNIAQQENSSLYEAEMNTIGLNHAGAGSIIMKRWRLSDLLVDTIKDHHTPFNQLKKGFSHEFAGMVKLGNVLAKARNIGFGGDEILDDTGLHDCEFLKIPWKKRESVIEEAEKEIHSLQSFIFDEMSTGHSKSALEKRDLLQGDNKDKSIFYLCGHPIVWNLPVITLLSSGYNVKEMFIQEGHNAILHDCKDSSILILDCIDGTDEWIPEIVDKISKKQTNIKTIIYMNATKDVIGAGSTEKFRISEISRPIHTTDFINKIDSNFET